MCKKIELNFCYNNTNKIKHIVLKKRIGYGAMDGSYQAGHKPALVGNWMVEVNLMTSAYLISECR